MAKIIQPARAHNRRSLLTAAHHSLACLRVELSGNPRRAMPMQLTASLPPIRGRSEGGKVRWGRARAGGKRREGKDVPGGFWMQRVSAAQHFALVDHICHVDGSTGLGTEPLRDLGNEGGGGRRRTEEGKRETTWEEEEEEKTPHLERPRPPGASKSTPPRLAPRHAWPASC
ncbi:unnamed protein product [Prorocentrum cordatum]|uniref:Uncharacterized protein n=1 Tax=Prorocentrum cordatum TaxID=2364126 RepID=A0ABN9PSF4_9DINO|nr:unnamed protein product [Polarella glacialis]